jgi:hypothetical protein
MNNSETRKYPMLNEILYIMDIDRLHELRNAYWAIRSNDEPLFEKFPKLRVITGIPYIRRARAELCLDEHYR